jgi:hypothetical protein
MSLQRRVVTIAVLLIALSLHARATQIVVVVTRDGIVIASDSKQRAASNAGMSVNPKTTNKIVVLNKRTAIATVGMGNMRITSGGKVVFDFDSRSFLEGIKRSLPPSASLSSIQSAVIDQSRSAMEGLSTLVADGSFQEQNAPDGDIVDFIIAGYENGVPVVHKVRIECDWNTRKLSNPIVAPIDSPIAFFGRNLTISDAANPGSAEHKAAEARYPGVIRGLGVFRGQSVNSVEGIGIAADLIRLEGEFDPANVGPPINIVVLSSARPPAVSVLPK